MSLCKSCKHRFRRVFIPLRPESYEDEYGERILKDDDNIIIMNQCLIISMDLDGEDTVTCSKYEERDDNFGREP